MSEMLDRIAEAGSTYWVLNDFVHSFQYQIIGENFDGEFYELEKDAEDACKRMNARAVLEVLMEPTPEMLQAAQDCESDPWEWADIWQAMLAEILKE